MADFIAGVRLHDYGKGTPDELFGQVAADDFSAVQLAYKKAIAGVNRYADVTDALVAQTLAASRRHNLSIAVLGTYVELAIDNGSRLQNTADFISQLAVCKALGAGCIGTETTSMAKQPAGTTRERAQYLLCKSLEAILPEAEALGVTVAIEPVTYHSVNSPRAARRILDTMQSPSLGILFDMSNLVDAANADRQQAIWEEVGTLLGSRITAVHFKGQSFRPDGSLLSTSLPASATDYAGAFRMLRALPQPVLPVLREEAVPSQAAADLAFMRRFFTG